MSTNDVRVFTDLVAQLGDHYRQILFHCMVWLADSELPSPDDENGVHAFARALHIDEMTALQYIIVLSRPGGVCGCRN